MMHHKFQGCEHVEIHESCERDEKSSHLIPNKRVWLQIRFVHLVFLRVGSLERGVRTHLSVVLFVFLALCLCYSLEGRIIATVGSSSKPGVLRVTLTQKLGPEWGCEKVGFSRALRVESISHQITHLFPSLLIYFHGIVYCWAGS